MSRKGARCVTLAMVVTAICAASLLAMAALPVEKLAPGVAFLRRDDTPNSPAGTGFFVASAERLTS
jgi:hypothetical protein